MSEKGEGRVEVEGVEGGGEPHRMNDILKLTSSNRLLNYLHR